MSGLKNIKTVGFTLLEMILVIAVIGILSGITLPSYNKFQNSNNLELATMELVQALRRANLLSLASSRDSSWGVFLSSGQITLFKGSSYLSRDINYDENYNISDIIQISGLSEVVFAKFSASPQSTGTINFSINANTNKTITINSRGIISY
ncbi:MAG: type II secretion system protein [Patescibacteria group bacterium]|jgi:prepilin-type N-terminal cleavage/methylation domain-containing protein